MITSINEFKKNIINEQSLTDKELYFKLEIAKILKRWYKDEIDTNEAINELNDELHNAPYIRYPEKYAKMIQKISGEDKKNLNNSNSIFRTLADIDSDDYIANDNYDNISTEISNIYKDIFNYIYR